MHKHGLIFIVLLLFVSIVTAQKKKLRHPQRDSSIVMIFTQNTTPHATNIKDTVFDKNIIKIAPLGFISGTYPIIYERKISDDFSLLGGIGFTGKCIARNFLYNLNEGSKNDFNTDPYGNHDIDLADNLYAYNHRVTNTGSMYFFQVRKYIYDSEGMNGGFVGAAFSNTQYNFTHQGIMSYKNSKLVYGGPDKPESETYKELYAVFGYQQLYNKFSLELSSEIGFGFVNGTKYCVYYDSFNSKLSEFFTDYNRVIFHLNLGVKVGYHF